jgi:hypothetical protein
MPTRRKIWVGFWTGVFFLTLAIWIGGWFHPESRGLTITGTVLGMRQFDDDLALICGVYDNHGTIAYYPWIVPTSIYGYRVLNWGDYQWGNFLGFRIMPHFPARRDWYFAVGVPFWFLWALSALSVFRSLRKRISLPGLCAKCGYDLRASSERCPECGTAVRGANSAALC